MTNLADSRPHPGESLADYVRRLRSGLKLSQRAVAARAGLHLQSLGKIEAGRTARLNAKSKAGLSRVLGIPEDYLEAAGRGLPVAAVLDIKICPRCWTAGTEADPCWLDRRALFCFICGTPLRDRCDRCHQPLPSLKFKFCPFCGQAYQESASDNLAEFSEDSFHR